MPSTSFLSVLAGTLVAFGAVALILAAAGAVGSQIGLTADGISTDEWRQAGIAGAAAAAVVLFGSFFFGGYTAGRMSRRAGLQHGLGVFLLAAVIVAVVAGLAAWLGDPDAVRETFSDNGVPTDANTWSDIGIGAAIAAGVAVLLGSLLGGMKGDRWHTQLVRTAVEHREERVTRADHDGEGDDDRRPKHALGQDPTTVDVRENNDGLDREPSVEEERERARTGRSDVGH